MLKDGGVGVAMVTMSVGGKGTVPRPASTFTRSPLPSLPCDLLITPIAALTVSRIYLQSSLTPATLLLG